MTQDEAVEKGSYGENADQEQAHWDADDVLLAVLRANGPVGRWACNEYDALRGRVGGFWYA